MGGFSYEIPNDFENYIIQYLQQKDNRLADAFRDCSYEYEDLGLAYYAGVKGDNWNKKALNVTIRGNEQSINLLKKNKVFSEIISSALQPQKTGFVLKDVVFLESNNKTHIEVGNELEKKFIEISNRQASFDRMSQDEKLEELNNLIEKMLKNDKGFIELQYDSVCFEYVTNDDVMKYRKKTHCFRHSSDASLQERKSYTDEQKTFLIDYGIIIVKAIHSLINKSNEGEHEF